MDSWILNEHCSEPQEHPTAARFRELGVLSPVREGESQWLLTKGFKTGVRGWIGDGRKYIRMLGASTALTPVPFPASEDLSTNIWVKWAVKDHAASKRYWARFQSMAKTTRRGGDFLEATRIFLDRHESNLVEKDLEAFVRRVMEEEVGVKL